MQPTTSDPPTNDLRYPPTADARLLHITTVPLTLRFLRGQLRLLRGSGIEPHVLSSPGDSGELAQFANSESVPAHAVRMTRTMSPWTDLRSLLHLWRRVRKTSPTILHAHTPKAGLLGMLAATFSATPIRIYHLRGLPMLTARGPTRTLLRLAEKISCSLAHRVLCVSHSLRDLALEEGLCSPAKLKVLGAGSGQGVDTTDQFNPARFSKEDRTSLRASLEIPGDAPVIGFVGRLVGDKGIGILARAWANLRKDLPDAHLLLIGPEEERDPVPKDTLATLRADSRVHVLGLIEDPAPYYAVMDVVALPTEREGFPNVPLEAGAMGIPVVASRVTGCVDAINDGETGRLIPASDDKALHGALREYLAQRSVCERHGAAARRHVVDNFEQQAVSRQIHETYRSLLGAVPRLRRRSRGSGLALKRALDLVGAGVGLIVLSPILGLLALLIRTKLGGPVLFRQERPGLNGQVFTILKFRTMTDERDGHGNLLPDDQRLGRFGQVLRSTSLDELPELWNVLRGDMSLVGPRPLLIKYLQRYSTVQARRHEFKPGITGWAQVNGRNSPSWETKLALDVWYVDHWSFLLDIRILFRTIGTLVRRDGIEHGDHVTMPEFEGTAGGNA